MNNMKILSAALAAGLLSSPVQASFIIAEGFDLLFTPGDGGSFYELPAPGNPLIVLGSDASDVGEPICGANSFNFGDGCVPTFQTDSIIQRKEEASVSGDGETATIEIELVALSLKAIDPIDLGGGLETVHARVLKDIVNDVWIHGEDMGSTMSITFDDMFGGTFTSALHFTFDLFGSLSGYLGSETVEFTQDGAPWSRIPPDHAVLVDGENSILNGVDNADDFFPGIAEHCDGPNKCHKTRIAVAPIPAALPLMATAIGGLGFIARRRRASKSL